MLVSYAGQHALQSIFTFGASKDDSTGQVAWMTYLGDSLDPQQELADLLKKVPATE
jgi:hypothetical protein